MNSIRLARNGMILAEDGNQVLAPLPVLAGKISLESGYTLRSFLEMMQRYPALQEISVFIPPLLEEYGRCRGSGAAGDALTHLELTKKAEMVGYPGDPRFNILCSLSGHYNEAEQELRLFQLHALLDVPIKLGRLRHTVFGDTVNIMDFETDFTLFEFIEGVAWEFGFQRFPEHCSVRG